MIARLFLIAVQAVVAWYARPFVAPYVQKFDQLEVFLYAAVFAVIVWVIGILGGLVLKDVARPSPSTLLFSFAVAVIFACITLLPDAMAAISRVVPASSIDPLAFPLIGAVLGYAVKR